MEITREELFEAYQKESYLFETKNINEVLLFVKSLINIQETNDPNVLKLESSKRYRQMQANHFFAPPSWPKSSLTEVDKLSAVSFLSVFVNDIITPTKPSNLTKTEIKKHADILFKELINNDLCQTN